MSNRSYVIALVKQTFINSWRISPRTFVNSVSNKHHSWTHTRHRVQQTCRLSLDQGANWFGAPATNARRVSEANKIFNRTNPPIVAKIKDCENCTHAKFAQFSNNWQRFFSDTRLRYKLSIIDPRPSRNGYGRALVTPSAPALAFLETTLPVKKTLAQFMTYEQLLICQRRKLPRSNVSIVLRKLAIVNTRRNVSKVVHSDILLTYE